MTLVAFDPIKDKTYQFTRLGRDVADFLAWKELGGASPRTLSQYERDLSRGALMFPDRDAGSLEDSEMLHIARQFTAGERRVRVAAYRSFYKWALGTRRAIRNPCDALPDFARPGQKVYDTFNQPEIESLCGLGGIDGPLMEIKFGTGSRKGDDRRLQLKHFRPSGDPEVNDAIAFLSGKGRKDRLVPIKRRVSTAIAELSVLEGLKDNDFLWYSVRANEISRKVMRRTAVGEGTYARWWSDCLERAGVRYRNPHMARHTFATGWLRDGGRLETLSMILGHSSIKTTFDEYGHLDTRDVLADLAVIEGRA